MLRSVKKKARSAIISAAALAVCATVAAPSQARLILAIDDLATAGVDAVIIDNFDGGVGDATPKGAATTADGSLLNGLVSFSGTVGGFALNIDFGASKPIIGNPLAAMLNLVSITVSGLAGGGVLDIMLTDTDYSLPSGDPWKLSHDITGSTGPTLDFVTAAGFFGPGNGEFEMGLTPGVLGPFGPGAFAASAETGIPDQAGPFSLTQSIRVRHTGIGVTSFNSKLVATVSEPGALAMLGFGLLGLGFVRRRWAA